MPTSVLNFVAEQLGIEDPSCIKRYAERESTAWEHTAEIREVFDYRTFSGDRSGCGHSRTGSGLRSCSWPARGSAGAPINTHHAAARIDRQRPATRPDSVPDHSDPRVIPHADPGARCPRPVPRAVRFGDPSACALAPRAGAAKDRSRSGCGRGPAAPAGGGPRRVVHRCVAAGTTSPREEAGHVQSHPGWSLVWGCGPRCTHSTGRTWSRMKFMARRTRRCHAS